MRRFLLSGIILALPLLAEAEDQRQRQGSLDDGRRIGLWEVSDAAGSPLLRARYERGSPVGPLVIGAGDGRWSFTYPHTRDAMESRLAELWPRPIPISYEKTAQLTLPFSLPVLSENQHAAALAKLNAYRFCAGVADDVRIDAELQHRVAHGAVVLHSLGGITHYPAQPEGMDDAFYKLGYQASSKSNLLGGFLKELSTMVDFFIWDSDGRNGREVGHCRWALNPSMAKTGFGASGGLGLMWAVDKSRRDPGPTWVSWPGPGWQPSALLPRGLSWSLHLEWDAWRVPKTESVQVRMQRLDQDYQVIDDIPLVFSVVESRLGGPNIAVVFKPAKYPFAAMDDGLPDGQAIVRVEVSGLRPKRGKNTAIS